jgi:hypothetical protein
MAAPARDSRTIAAVHPAERWRVVCIRGALVTRQAGESAYRGDRHDPADALVALMHNGLPVLLPPQNEQRWLGTPSTPVSALLPLPEPLPPGRMEAYRVAPLVNSFKNEGPELIVPPATPDAPSAVQARLF